MIRFNCDACGKALAVADAKAGAAVICPGCKQRFKVPAAQAPADDDDDDIPTRPSSLRARDDEDEGEPAENGFGLARDVAKKAPAVRREDEIPISRKGIFKSLIWFSIQQMFFLVVVVGMSILLFLALKYQGVSTIGDYFKLGFIALFIFVFFLMLVIGLRGWRLFLFTTIRQSSHYLLKHDMLQRCRHDGEVLEQIPFSNIADVRMITIYDEEDPDVKVRVLGIDLIRLDRGKTILDHHFNVWSRKAYECDVAMLEEFFDIPIRHVKHKIKKRWQQWQDDTRGSDDDERPTRRKRRQASWLQRHRMALGIGALAVGILLGLGVWLVPMMLNRDAQRGAAHAGWGNVFDPDGDCTVTPAGKALTIALPAKPHDLTGERGRVNAPRVLQDWDDDVAVQVKVAGGFKPTAPASGPGLVSFQAGGILLWGDSANYVRLERAAMQTHAYASVEVRAGGRVSSTNPLMLGPNDIYLRLERRGANVVGFVSGNGRDWQRFQPLSVTLPSRIQAGVAAINTAAEPLSVSFDDFWIGRPDERPGDKKPDPKPPDVKPPDPKIPDPKPPDPKVDPPKLDSLSPKSLPGLLAYWPLDDGRGQGVMDVSGNAMLAIANGGTWIDGVKGTALKLNGTTDFVNLGPDRRLNFAANAPFTVAGWFATDANAAVIYSMRRLKAFPVVEISVRKGNLHGWVRDDTSGFGGAKVAGQSVKDGRWHHAALLRYGDGAIELFLDAVSQGRDKGTASTGPITTDLRTLGADRFLLANRKNTPFLSGGVDEFCIYNRALEPREVAALAGKN